MRLQRHLAQCGVASRRRAEELIRAGCVRVNGKTITELGTQVDPAADVVEVDGQVIHPPTATEVWMLHKPRGVVTTMRDPQGRKTVAQLVKSRGRRLVPVGRLDLNTTGLLLMTDDGDLALRLTHPRWGVEKEYLATVEGRPSRATLARLRAGIEIEGRLSAFVRLAQARGFGPAAKGQTRWLATVHEGRHHLVRRLFEAVGHTVVRLHRTRTGPLELGTLGRGESRRLTPEEVATLRRAVGLSDGQEKDTPKKKPRQAAERRDAAARDRRDRHRGDRAAQPPRQSRSARGRGQKRPRSGDV